MDDRQALRLHSLGEKTPQLVFRNGLVFNVFTGELLPGDIAVQNGVIVGVGSPHRRRRFALRSTGCSVGWSIPDCWCAD